jgi:hypothetical protein
VDGKDETAWAFPLNRPDDSGVKTELTIARRRIPRHAGRLSRFGAGANT